MAVFLLFYQFLLEKERIHQFKRFFLLGALIASFIIPALVFTEYIEATASTLTSATPVYGFQESSLPLNKPAANIDVINWPLYTMDNLWFWDTRIWVSVHKAPLSNFPKNPKKSKVETECYNTGPLRGKNAPHTFFSYIFLE